MFKTNAEQSAGDTAQGHRGRVLLALVSEQEQVAVAQVVQQEGMTAETCASGNDLVEATKKVVPDLLIIDADRPRTDLASISRVIGRYNDTRAVLVVLVCAGGVDRAKAERLQSIKPFALLPRPLTCARLTEVLRMGVQHSRMLRQDFGLAEPEQQSTTRHVEGNSSLLIHEVSCPFHTEHTPLDRYVLRAGKIETEVSFFDIPVYKKATRGADFVDYNLLSITVCPQCLFASNDPAHFSDPAERSIKPIELNPATVNAVQGRTPVRRAMAQGISPDFYTHLRTPQQAVVALELAVESAKTLYEANKYSMPIELLRIANHHLRLLHLHQQLKSPAAKSRAHAREASEWLRKAFVLLEGNALYKTAYQLVAICIWTGEDKSAHQYISRLAELERDATLTKEEKAAVERYHARCKQAWEDRDLHRGPEYKPSEAQAA